MTLTQMPLTQITADRKAQITADRNTRIHADMKTQMTADDPRHGQASVEMTLGVIGALLLLLGSFKVFLWMNERLVTRQMQYEDSRDDAASHGSAEAMSRAYEPRKPLRVLNEPE